LAFVFDYKAAHKLKVEDLKPALANEKLFMEAIQQVHGNKIKTDSELREQDKADERVAMALTQVFDYMVQRGVAGYEPCPTRLRLAPQSPEPVSDCCATSTGHSFRTGYGSRVREDL
jgi:hypothetical protein